MGRIALELREDRLEGLAHEVGQHVQPATVRHAEHDFLEAELAAALQHLLHGGHQRLAAIQAEALGAGVFLVEETLEVLGRGQALEDRLLAVDREVGVVAAAFDALLDPGLLVRVLDVHELDADRAAIGLLAGTSRIWRSVAVSMPRTLLMKIGRSKSASVKP